MNTSPRLPKPNRGDFRKPPTGLLVRRSLNTYKARVWAVPALGPLAGLKPTRSPTTANKLVLALSEPSRVGSATLRPVGQVPLRCALSRSGAGPTRCASHEYGSP